MTEQTPSADAPENASENTPETGMQKTGSKPFQTDWLIGWMNPEFRRNIWLELGFMRLIGAPVGLGGLFTILMTQLDGPPGQTLDFAATIAFFLICGVGGCRRAANAIPNEMKLGTWDNQRMSGMSAFSMSWSKLIGSTIFQWYAGLFCLGWLIYARDLQGWNFKAQWQTAVTLAIVALCGQAIAMATALAFIRKNRFDKRFRVSFSHLVGLLSLMITYKLMAPGSITGRGIPGVGVGADFKQLIEWYGIQLNWFDFRVVAIGMLAFWSLVGLMRMMQIELRYRVRPIMWPLFTLAIVAFMHGFAPSIVTIVYDPLIGMTFGALALTYVALFLQPKDPVEIAYLLHGKAPFTKRMRYVPMWLFPLVVTIILGSILGYKLTGEKTVLGVVNPLGLGGFQHLGIPRAEAPTVIATTVALIATTVALIAFVLRDILLVHFMAMRKGMWRSDWGGFFVLVGLYSILPAVLRVMGRGEIIPYLMPYLSENPAPMLISGFAQAGVLLVLVIWQWKISQPDHAAAPPTLSAEKQEAMTNAAQ